MAKRKKLARHGGIAAGRLKTGLRDHRQLRNRQRYLLTAFSPLIEAFDEQLDRLDALARTRDLNPETRHLIETAAAKTVAGVDHMMNLDEPHDVEEARMLMEIDFLLREFAANPTCLDVWASLSDFERGQQFGFGKLRDREERRQGLSTGEVLPEREQWITHSVHSHPLPLKDPKPAERHPSFSLLNSVADLFGHLRTVEVSARKFVEASTGSLPSGYDDLPLQESGSSIVCLTT